jgi:hypothetical protein
MRDRTVDLEISRAETDRIAGLADGHSGKLLSENPVKTFGLKSLGDMLGALGLILMVVEDPAARDRTLARREPVEARNQRFGSKNANTKPSAKNKVAAPQRSEPPVSHAHLRVIQSRGSGCKF